MVYRACNFEGDQVICPSDTRGKIKKLKSELPPKRLKSRPPREGEVSDKKAKKEDSYVKPAAFIKESPANLPTITRNDAFLRNYGFSVEEIQTLATTLRFTPDSPVLHGNIITKIQTQFFFTIQKKVRLSLNNESSEYVQRMRDIRVREDNAHRDYSLGLYYRKTNGLAYTLTEYIEELSKEKDQIVSEQKNAIKKMIGDHFALLSQELKVNPIPRRDGVIEYIIVPNDNNSKAPAIVVYEYLGGKIEVKISL